MIPLQAGSTHEGAQRTANLTKEDFRNYEQTRLNMLLDLFSWAENARKGVEAKWQQAYEFYYGVDREYKNKQAHQSKIVLPTTFEIVETKTPQIMMSMFTQQPIYSVNEVGADDPWKAKIAEALLTWQMRQTKNVILNHTLWLKDSFLYGGAIAKTGWEYTTEVVPRTVQGPTVIDFMTRQIMEDHYVINERVVTQDGPVMTNCDNGEIYPDPSASDIEDCKFVIHRMMVPLITLQAGAAQGLYRNVDKIRSGQGITTFLNDFAQRRYSTHNFTDPIQHHPHLYDYVEVLECWWVDPTDPDLKKYKTTIANRECVIQDVPLSKLYWHNRFPFVLLKNIPMTKEFWGLSEIDVTIPLQKEMNSLRNQRMDNLNAILKAYWLVERSTGINQEKMKRLAPGDIVFTNNISGVKIERPPSIDGLTFNSEASTRSDIQRAANMNDMITGTPTRSQVRNATTASLLNEGAKTRWGLTVLLYTEQAQRIGQDFIALNQQFLRKPQVIEIMGEDGMVYQESVDASKLPRNPDIFCTLGFELMSNKELRKQQLIQVDPLVVNTPGANVTLWRKDLLKDYGFRNPERYFEGSFVAPPETFLGGESTQSSYLDQLQSLINPAQPNQMTYNNVGEAYEQLGSGNS